MLVDELAMRVHVNGPLWDRERGKVASEAADVDRRAQPGGRKGVIAGIVLAWSPCASTKANAHVETHKVVVGGAN